jgi:hypothetical protein
VPDSPVPVTSDAAIRPRRPDLWSLDEYIVVADLYLRRGRSSGIHDTEVKNLAKLTGRSPASISRRLGNYKGTMEPGTGLKPVLGEAEAVFARMRSSTALRQRLTREARARLLIAGGSIAAPAVAAPRLVDPENFVTDSAEVMAPVGTRELHRLEAQLVRRYRSWLDPAGTRLQGLVIPVPNTTLRADLFDTSQNLLIEAKGAVTREHVRYGVGQLLDYRRHIASRPDMALLLPARLPDFLTGLPREAGIEVIWENADRFLDSRDGMLTTTTGQPPRAGESPDL